MMGLIETLIVIVGIFVICVCLVNIVESKTITGEIVGMLIILGVVLTIIIMLYLSGGGS